MKISKLYTVMHDGKEASQCIMTVNGEVIANFLVDAFGGLIDETLLIYYAANKVCTITEILEAIESWDVPF